MTKEEIATSFSTGKFDEVIEFIDAEAVWEVVEESRFVGRKAIVENFNQVSAYFRSVTSEFNTLHVIAQGNKVVVNGTAKFIKDGKKVSFVSACDLYEFTIEDRIRKITSYCIFAKEA